MDWATFFKDNSQSLFTLGGVFLGSLITFIINYLNLKTQSKERDKDRQEQRKEAKTQLALELIRNDVKIMEEAIDNTLKSLDYIERLNLTLLIEEDLSDEEIRGLMEKELFSAVESNFYKLGELDAVSDKIAHSFGYEFCSQYEGFSRLAFRYSEQYTDFDRKTWSKEYGRKLRDTITDEAGKLHIMLNEKLISVREG